MSGLQHKRQARERMLVCLDLQNASLGGWNRPWDDPCVVNCRRVLAHARACGWRVVHVHARHASAADARPIKGLGPTTGEMLVYRDGVSAFSSRVFRRLTARYAGEMIVIGYSMSSSCLATALVAYDNDLAVTLVEDAVSATPQDETARDALETISRMIARPFVGVTSTGDLLGRERQLRLVG